MAECRIIGHGYYLPEIERRSRDLVPAGLAGELESRFEVNSRRFIPEGMSGVDMAAASTKEAAKRANIEISDIDMIIYATAFPDHQFPGNSAFLQPVLGLEGKPALDLRCQQAGFVAALDAACALIELEKYETILVVGSDIHSTALNTSEEGMKTDFPFGDGAGAFIVSSKGEGPKVGRPVVMTDSRFAMDYYIPLGSQAHPRLAPSDIEKGLQYQRINWDKLWQFAMDKLPEALNEAAERAGFDLKDADLIAVPHLKPSMAEELARKADVDADRITTILPEVGNIGNAAIPVAYCIAVEQGRRMDRAVFASFGSGFSIGAFGIKG